MEKPLNQPFILTPTKQTSTRSGIRITYRMKKPNTQMEVIFQEINS